MKTLLACKSYGAESRIGGDCRNTIFGVVAGWEEIVTPLEMTMELYDKKDSLDARILHEMLNNKYKALAGNPDRVTVLAPAEVDTLVKECGDTKLDRSFLDKSYNDVTAYRKAQDEKK
jgi:hypothetical protein